MTGLCLPAALWPPGWALKLQGPGGRWRRACHEPRPCSHPEPLHRGRYSPAWLRKPLLKQSDLETQKSPVIKRRECAPHKFHALQNDICLLRPPPRPPCQALRHAPRPSHKTPNLKTSITPGSFLGTLHISILSGSLLMCLSPWVDDMEPRIRRRSLQQQRAVESGGGVSRRLLEGQDPLRPSRAPWAAMRPGAHTSSSTTSPQGAKGRDLGVAPSRHTWRFYPISPKHHTGEVSEVAS